MTEPLPPEEQPSRKDFDHYQDATLKFLSQLGNAPATPDQIIATAQVYATLAHASATMHLVEAQAMPLDNETGAVSGEDNETEAVSGGQRLSLAQQVAQALKDPELTRNLGSDEDLPDPEQEEERRELEEQRKVEAAERAVQLNENLALLNENLAQLNEVRSEQEPQEQLNQSIAQLNENLTQLNETRAEREPEEQLSESLAQLNENLVQLNENQQPDAEDKLLAQIVMLNESLAKLIELE